MRLVDQYGNAFDSTVLKNVQTASVTALEHRMIDSQLDGITPSRAAGILRDADAGNIVAQSQLFDDMFDRDAHMRAEMAKRAGALLGLDWSIEPPPNATPTETDAAERVESTLRDAVDDLEDVILAMMEGVSHGFAGIELEWQRTPGGWIPRFHPRPQTWFTLSQNRRELLLDNGGGGVPLNPMGWIMHQHTKPKTGYIGRMGLGRVLIWPFLYKAYSLGDFAEFLDVYGLPIIIGKYSAAANDDGKRSLMRAVASLGRDARAVMPDDMSIEVQKITASGDGSPHLAMMEWAERAMSKAILGQTTSADAQATGMGSGVANLHDDVRHDILLADARQIAGTLTRDLVYPLIVLNGGGIESYWRCPRWVFEQKEDSEDFNTFSTGLQRLVDIGVAVPEAWVRDKLHIPEAKAGEKVLVASQGQPVTALTRQTHGTGCQCDGCTGVAALKAGDPLPDTRKMDDRDGIDQAIDAEMDGLEPVMQGMIDPIQALFDQAVRDGLTAEELVAQLPDLLHKINPDALQESLARAAFAARLVAALGVNVGADSSAQAE